MKDNNSSSTIHAVRGAVQLPKDSIMAMRDGVTELIPALCKANGISEPDIVSIQFTQTDDLTAANPARELRSIGFASTPLFCAAEPLYPDYLPRTVRVLLTFRGSAEHAPQSVYLGGARVLRSDT
ncbi:chorismate mutase [Spirochaeta africana]|nr:chorismate mutase [Spirochaeta africana]